MIPFALFKKRTFGWIQRFGTLHSMHFIVSVKLQSCSSVSSEGLLGRWSLSRYASRNAFIVNKKKI